MHAHCFTPPPPWLTDFYTVRALWSNRGPAAGALSEIFEHNWRCLEGKDLYLLKHNLQSLEHKGIGNTMLKDNGRATELMKETKA